MDQLIFVSVFITNINRDNFKQNASCFRGTVQWFTLLMEHPANLQRGVIVLMFPGTHCDITWYLTCRVALLSHVCLSDKMNIFWNNPADPLVHLHSPDWAGGSVAQRRLCAQELHGLLPRPGSHETINNNKTVKFSLLSTDVKTELNKIQRM